MKNDDANNGQYIKAKCDLENDGSLDELEVKVYEDRDCDHKVGDKIELKPTKCHHNPWFPGKYVKLTFRPPPTLLEVLAVLGVLCCCCCCLICCAVALGGKSRKYKSGSSWSGGRSYVSHHSSSGSGSKSRSGSASHHGYSEQRDEPHYDHFEEEVEPGDDGGDYGGEGGDY